MPIAFLCPHCGVKVFAPKAGAGKEGTCPHCNRDIIVPRVRRSPTRRPDLAPPPATAPARPATPAARARVAPPAETDEEDVPLAVLDRRPGRGKLVVVLVGVVVLAGLAVGGYVLFGPSDEGGSSIGGGGSSGDVGGDDRAPAASGADFVGTWEFVKAAPKEKMHFTKKHSEYQGLLTIREGKQSEAEYVVTTGQGRAKRNRPATFSDGALDYDNPIARGNMSFHRDGHRLKLTWRLTDADTIEAWYVRADLSETKTTRQVSLPTVRLARSDRFLAQRISAPTHYFMGKPMGGGPKFGFVDRSGEFVIAPTMNRATRFREGRAYVRDNLNALSCIDMNGVEVFKGQATRSSSGLSRGWHYSDFSGGLSLVRKVLLNNWGQATHVFGYVDVHGETVLDPRFGGAADFSDGLAAARSNEPKSKWGYVDRTGKFAIPPRFDPQPGQFSEGLAVFQEDRRFGYINKLGIKVVTAVYRSAHPFHNGLARVGTAIGPAVIDATGKVLLRPAPSLDGDFRDGMARIKVGKKYGFMSNSLKVAIAPRYDQAREFSEGLAAVCVGGKWGYIDRSGKMVIPLRFPSASDFYGGWALVGLPGGVLQSKWTPQTGYIDRTGAFAWKFKGK